MKKNVESSIDRDRLSEVSRNALKNIIEKLKKEVWNDPMLMQTYQRVIESDRVSMLIEFLIGVILIQSNDVRKLHARFLQVERGLAIKEVLFPENMNIPIDECNNIEDCIEKINKMIKKVYEMKKAHPEDRLGITYDFGSVLNGYREGDLSFNEAKAAIEEICKKKNNTIKESK